jgi:hypothetical protein
MNEGYRRKKKLFNEQGRAQLEKLVVVPGLGGAGKNYWNCRTNGIQSLRVNYSSRARSQSTVRGGAVEMLVTSNRTLCCRI